MILSFYQGVSMKQTVLVIIIAMILSGCTKEIPSTTEQTTNKTIFSGRVEHVYYVDETGATSGYTRFDKGLPGTSTTIKEDVWVDIFPNWVVIKLMNRKGYEQIIPQHKIVSIAVGTKEGNELNIPKES
jgi:hypothetical protein